jgi:hypothetical protein
MNMHFSFASNMRKNGASWLIDDEDVNGEKYRSREQAIKEACKLLKRSRGREVGKITNFSEVIGLGKLTESSHSYPVCQIPFSLVSFSGSIAARGETLLDYISRTYGKRPTDSSSFSLDTSPMKMSVRIFSDSGCIPSWRKS